MERMCEPRFGTSTHGNIRKRGLSTTSGRFFSRFSGVHPMKSSRRASFQAAVEKPSMASGIVNDANRYAVETVGNPAYPLELFQRVITVSLETMKSVRGLPKLEVAI